MRLDSALCAADEGSWERRKGPRGARAGKRGRIYSRNEETETGRIRTINRGYDPLRRLVTHLQQYDFNHENRRALCGPFQVSVTSL